MVVVFVVSKRSSRELKPSLNEILFNSWFKFEHLTLQNNFFIWVNLNFMQNWCFLYHLLHLRNFLLWFWFWLRFLFLNLPWHLFHFYNAFPLLLLLLLSLQRYSFFKDLFRVAFLNTLTHILGFGDNWGLHLKLSVLLSDLCWSADISYFLMSLDSFRMINDVFCLNFSSTLVWEKLFVILAGGVFQ